MNSPDDNDRWLIVGLGNPGPEYVDTRHNVGFMVVDQLAQGDDHLAFKNATRFKGQLGLATLGKLSAVLLKPQTYMNLSGESVEPVAHFYRISLDHIIVIHDDVDLELGRIKIKQGGGDGGHKGLLSMSNRLGSPNYFRVRVGVGRPKFGDVSDFVLKAFHPDELDAAQQAVEKAAKAVRILASRGLKEAMNRFNRAPKKAKAPAPGAGLPGEAGGKKGEIDLESRGEND